MRIKFKKGATPDLIVAYLKLYFEDKVIGSVNVYVQEYDDDMKAIHDGAEYIVIEPAGTTKEKYDEYVAEQRRKRMKAV